MLPSRETIQSFFPQNKKIRKQEKKYFKCTRKSQCSDKSSRESTYPLHLITRARFKAQLYCWLHTDVRFKRVSVPDILLGCVK